ncbi:hypothetical protein OUZ56_026510 [Daphnia magna]|uniref:Uncharacterized protein n=1 Tax=Daphnia magna TaxID=35525 RepID=A0ABQ9ZM23_9CRUS|nr:hypothetical protein OUZ56_026510 [Daphnia magna]
MLPSATTNDQSSKTQSQDILSYNLSNAEKAQQQLTTMVRDQAVYELTRIETIERNHHGLKASIRQSRNQRGLFDGGGKILNWLFDVSTTEELDKVNNQVAKLSTETTAIVNALETHATLINETMWELHASKEATDALQRSCLTLNKELNNAKRTINNLSREIKWDWKSQDKIDNAFRATGLHTDSTNNRVRDLTTGMVHQMDGLSDLEHARLNIDNTQTYPRYPWEWIVILILCTLGTGIAIAADRTKTASRLQKIEAQIQALERRLQLHDQATIPDETE